MNYGFGQTMHQVASDCGAASQTVWRWIEEAREGLKGGLKGWLREALLEMVAFALLVEEKPLTPEEIQCELIEHIVWLDTLLLARRLDDEGTQPAINWTALGWNRTDREPTYEEFQSLLREEIASIDAKIRSLMTPQASHETE
jgi:hypothetical protein